MTTAKESLGELAGPDMAYEIPNLVTIANIVLARDGNVNIIRCEQEWRRHYPKEVAHYVPATVVWEAAFRMMGLAGTWQEG